MAPQVIPKGFRHHKLTKKQQVIRIIYFTPLVLLLLERLWIPLENASLESYLHVEDTATTVVLKTRTKLKYTQAPSLELLTSSSKLWTPICPSSMHSVEDVILENSESSRIPKIVHQTAKSRCVTQAYGRITKAWKFPEYSYYFHDEEAMNKLLTMDFPEFPHLKSVLRNCVTDLETKTNLWSYVVLWVYGGIYADFDSEPRKLNEKTIQNEDDGFFVVDRDHVVSHWFMAVSPRHPLMFHAIQNTLQNIVKLLDVKKTEAHVVSGPYALHQAFADFRREMKISVEPVGSEFRPVWSGNFPGTSNRTITVVGSGTNENEYVERKAINAVIRARDHKTMGMSNPALWTHPFSKRNGGSCLDNMLSEVMEAVPPG